MASKTEDPHHGLRETYHDLEVAKLEELAKRTDAEMIGELLAALKTLADFAHNPSDVDDADYRMALQRADDAIAKATGAQS